MLPLITSQQIRRYIQFGWIEFDQFLSEEEVTQVFNEAKNTLLKRLQPSKSSLSTYSADALYEKGRDLWRDSALLKNLYCSPRFGETASSLSNKTQIFLTCDQWIPEGKRFSPLQLEAHLSFQNLACGCLLSLEGETRGNVRFLQSERLVPFDKSQLLITFGTLQTVYVYNEHDPHNHALKHLGYSFGDCLSAPLHPPCKI